MRNHIKVTRDIHLSSGHPLELIREIEEASEGLVNPQYGTWENEIEITGWRPMTDKEIEAAKKQRARQREQSKKRKAAREAKDFDKYLELKARFEENE